MLIRQRKASDPKPSEITPQSTYVNRRRILAAAGFAGVAGAGLMLGLGGGKGDGGLGPAEAMAKETPHGPKLPGVVKNPKYVVDEPVTNWDSITSYNNFYELGTDKDDPKRNAASLVTEPWSVKVDGLVEHPGTYDVADLIKDSQLEERIYRLRCVEAWSMVVPWVGVPLADVLKRLGPRADAKYVAFETLLDPARLPGQERAVLNWPYVEGLRLDEAMHPLTLLTVGLYGEKLPAQNGAPIRLVVPWKYGFKSIKSIVRIRLTADQPTATWNQMQPREYGFYSNVNPRVAHPRWSQAQERRIGDSIFSPKRPTLMFNGYAEEVAPLYAGMDLKAYF
ncbi:MAG: protein-methionine-sulfoxide reductase catalytic subunit MsrP [Rhodobacterales bacterium]|nr:protein-methionine-sulfoxide reductase catalytic subunit MsrP [Rhodobacterales bacterium]